MKIEMIEDIVYLKGLGTVDVFKKLEKIERQIDMQEVSEAFSCKVYYYGVTAYKEQFIGLLSETGNRLMKSLGEKKIIGNMRDLKPLRYPGCGAERKWERLPSPDKNFKMSNMFSNVY